MQTLGIALILSCLAVSQASPDECAKGEHLWCSSLENAIKCSAVKHCLATVWSNDLLKEHAFFDNCDVCVKFFKGAKDFLEDETMRKTAVLLMKEEICPLFGEFEKTCRVAVDHYANDILDFLASRIDPDAICKVVHICPDNGTVVQMFKLKDAKRFDDVDGSKGTCEMCKFLIDELKKFIGSEPTEEKIEEALEKLCSLMPESMKHACDDFVKKYSQLIIKLLLENMDTVKICEAVHLCPDSVEKCPKKSGMTSIDKCEVCEIIMGFLEGLLELNSTVEQIERAALKVCNFLPCQYKDFCDDLIEEYMPLIVKALVEKIKPHEACELLNMCNVGKGKMYFKCVAGPKYWCASEANARLCEAEDHCKKFVWT